MNECAGVRVLNGMEREREREGERERESKSVCVCLSPHVLLHLLPLFLSVLTVRSEDIGRG